MRSPVRRGHPLAVTLSMAALAALGLAVPAPATAEGAISARAPGDVSTRVVVTGPDAAAAAEAVQAAGGVVTAELPLVGGVAAVLPAGALLPAGFTVTQDRVLTFAGTDASPGAVTSTVRATLGLPPNGTEGQGVTVAMVDTGIADVADLRGRVVAHIDVTETGGGDPYGHGTFLAGLIAGDGSASDGAVVGVAPGAKLLDVKVARPDGGTDLSTVLTGLQAVADQGNRYGVKVLNLSLASGSPVPYQVDPLNQALRALWRQGVTVVVAAGNHGPDPGSVEAPGNDPTLLTVGGLDERGTPAHGDDAVAGWSGRGPTSQGVSKPDLVAPGVSVIGLRAPGSIADTEHPTARIGTDYFRGSGTSMSAAVVSGAAADLLAQRTRLRPDGVKSLLMDTAYSASGLVEPFAAGKGGVDVVAALAEPRENGSSRSSPAAPGDAATWRKLAGAFEDDDPAKALKAWDALSPEARSWAARSWASLDGATQDWVARSWAARSWAGVGGVSGEEWVARSWAARSWAGDDWAARSWAARSWAGDDWAARSWAGNDWAARSWAARSWAADSWAARW